MGDSLPVPVADQDRRQEALNMSAGAQIRYCGNCRDYRYPPEDYGGPHYIGYCIYHKEKCAEHEKEHDCFIAAEEA